MKKIVLFLITILIVFLYYFFNESYRLSFEAKAYYEFGEYAKAEKLAKKAYEEDKYNRMAFTILTQSKIAKIWKNFIKESSQYILEIETISDKNVITKSDKAKIKMLLEIIINEFKNLPKSNLLDEKLKFKAQQNYMEAMNLYNEFFKNRDRKLSTNDKK